MNMSSSDSLSNFSMSPPVGGTAVGGWVDFSGRLLLSLLFLIAGLSKISSYSGTAAYMLSFGVPGGLLPLVIATEVGGALALILGWQARLAALLLAGYSLLAAVIFHHKLGDATEQIMFLKDLAIAGGLLLLVIYGAGSVSLDHRGSKRRAGSGLRTMTGSGVNC